MTDKLDHYETALLTELRGYVADRATIAAPARRRTRRYLAYAGVVAAAAAGIAVVSLPGSQAPQASAYSTVALTPNGGAHVEVSSLDDDATLERVLADHGVNADVTSLAPFQVCDEARYAGYVRDKEFRMVVGVQQDGFSFDISRLPAAGETLLIDWTAGAPDIDEQQPNRNHTWIGMVSGDVPECVPVAANAQG